jgi:hypothetical protein
MNNHRLTKAEEREKKLLKRRYAPTGGTMGAQRRRLETSKFYSGGSKKVKPKIKITIKR